MLDNQAIREMSVDAAYNIFQQMKEKERRGKSAIRLEKELYKYLDELNIRLDDLYDVENNVISLESLY